jgi:serine/threonine protein kinase
LASMTIALAPDLEVLRPLGQGSMATVLLARDPKLKRLVAVKLLRPELASDPVACARFEREAQAAAGVRHRNVTSIYRIGRAGKIPYIEMEYIRGRTLADLLAGNGPLEPDQTRKILRAVADALSTAHRCGVVHRDIRPANVLLEDESERVVLMDFGIAALLETGMQAGQRLTATGIRLGDPLRMSPEQLLGHPIGPATDVYGLGLLGFELLTGQPPRPPTASWNEPVSTKKAGKSDGDDPLSIPGRCPDSLANLVRRCLAVKPAHRPQLGELVDRLSDNSSTTSPDVTSGGKSIAPGFQEFLAEIRERKVARVGIAYIVFAFAFLQAVDLLLPALPWGNHDIWYRTIVAVSLCGFPVALVLGWLFDFTRQGIQRAPDATKGPARSRVRRLILPMVTLSVCILAAVAVWYFLFGLP